MSLSFYDTLAREKRAFVPADPDRVTLYVCGVTVYSYAHIGNARPAVVFDLAFRLLRHIFGEDHVLYARNITDVDDKINQAALDQGVDISAITTKFAEIYQADVAALGCLPPTFEPRATAHIPQMTAMISVLLERGHAYQADGHVLFDTQSFPDYGKLSGRTLDDLLAGARVEVADYKRHPADFVLWKPAKPGEPSWQSPFGAGRPGWHIECSAMIETVLGLPIDIHGGGHDLIFPHHENEIAQGRCAHDGADYARVWMHNGFLTQSAEKMSKSVGNIRTIHDLLADVPGEALRWALLSAHYRAPLEWNPELIAQSKRALDRLYGVLQRWPASPEAWPAQVPETVLDALEDDLATPRALAELFALARIAETAPTEAEKLAASASLLAAGRLMGFFNQTPLAWFSGGSDAAFTAKVEALISERAQARQSKNWAEADRIRAELTTLNVEVLDSATGVSWRLKG